MLATYTDAFERRQPFQTEYRLRRHDGQYRWVLSNAVPRFEADGSLGGYIGSCVDITDRKEADAMRSSFSRRLIQAQEEDMLTEARNIVGTGSLSYSFNNGDIVNLNGRYADEGQTDVLPSDTFSLTPAGVRTLVSHTDNDRTLDERNWEIGGGGSDIQFRTFNGDIMIRKR